MPEWVNELLAWIKDNAAWLVSAWAVWIAVRGRGFDARRSYSEFALKHRIEAAEALMKAAAKHVHRLNEVIYARNRVLAAAGTPEAAELSDEMQPVLDDSVASEIALSDASAAALPFFSNDLMTATNKIFDLHNRLVEHPDSTFDVAAARVALTGILDVVRKELDIDGVISYQRSLFKPSLITRARRFLNL